MFFPIRDDNPTFRKPILTVALIAVNTLIFLYTKSLGEEGFARFIYSFGFIPDLFLGTSQSYDLPTSYYLTPLTSMFLHGGWMHLIGNMLVLWVYGNNIEDYFGPVKFLIFYVIAGFAAVALYALFNLDSRIPVVGASGAIAGVMGAYMVLHPRAEITVLIFFFFIQFVVLPAKVVLGLWFGLQVVMSLIGSGSGGGTAWLAHVGGFIFGYLLLRLLVKLWGRHGGSGQRQQVYRMNW